MYHFSQFNLTLTIKAHTYNYVIPNFEILIKSIIDILDL